MASIKRIDGRLQNEKGEWVWNGESYEFVQSHSDWLPLTFQSQSDAAKFKKLENIYNAEQIIKNSKNPQEVLAAKQWLSRQGVKHDDMNDAMAYTYLYHSGKGKERAEHKYKYREWLGDGWRYFYDDLGYKHKKEADEYMRDIYSTKAELHSTEERLKNQEKWYNEKSKDLDEAERQLKYTKKKLDNTNKSDKEAREKAYLDYMDAEYHYYNQKDYYDAAKKYVEKSMNEIEHLKISLNDSQDYYNKEMKAYNKTIASKIDKGLKLVNKLFKKNK